jgi:hypothetical protein
LQVGDRGFARSVYLGLGYVRGALPAFVRNCARDNLPGVIVKRSISMLGFSMCLMLLCLPLAAQTTRASLDRGFHLLYDLQFAGAQQQFSNYERDHPDDPLGPVSEAAALLFSEFHRMGILEAQFFEKDSAFHGRPKIAPDASVRERFQAALTLAQQRARPQLARDPHDRDALFAMTLSNGLSADYFALVEKNNLAALRCTKQATFWAEQLLAVDPNYYDAYVATGMHKYIIGSMAAPMRWVLRLGGISGDKQAGIADLETTAQHGRYLAPFARILLAIAYMRQKDPQRARSLLAGLRQEFPANPLFARELARLDGNN